MVSFVWLLLIEFLGSYPVEWAWRKCSFPTEKVANLISADFWSTRLFLLGLLFFFLILSSSLDNPKFFRMYLNYREGAGNSLVKTVQALSFCHVILGDWDWRRSSNHLHFRAFAQKMKIVGDKLVTEISRKFWKALEGKEVDSKQRLSSHAACNAW